MSAAAAGRPGTVKQRLAAETLRLYAGDWAHFQAYCATQGQRALPAGADAVVAYFAASGCGRAALSRRLAAIDHQHRLRGLPSPGGDPGVRAALRRARRAAPRATRLPAPDPVALERMAEACRADLTGQRDRAVLLLLAAGLGRSAIVALQAEQLRFAEEGMRCPSGDGVRMVARSPRHDHCPVRAVEAWLRASATRYGPVFRKINRWGQLEHAALGADAIRLILIRRAP